VRYRETTTADSYTFPLSIPCCSPGALGERFAADIDEGDFIVVTHSELVYRRRDTTDGETSRLEILAWRVQKGEPIRRRGGERTYLLPIRADGT
jgi:hypothetical protein